MFNLRGQAFDTLKILIAAAIAMAILAVLLPIINSISGLTGTTASEDILRMATQASGNLALPRSAEVTFDNRTPGITAKAIANAISREADNVCLDFTAAPTANFAGSGTTGDTAIINYTTQNISKRVRAVVVCDASGVANLGGVNCDCGAAGPNVPGFCCGVAIKPL